MSRKMIPELSKEEETRALGIHEKAIVIDMCNNLHANHPSVVSGELFQTMREAGLTGTSVTMAGARGLNCGATMKALADWFYVLERRPEITLTTTAEDMERAKKTSKVAIMGAFQNGTPIEDDVDLLLVYHKLGIRIFQPTYNYANLLGSGCDERVDGLTKFGAQVVEELNRLHMLIDLSHCGIKTTMDTLEISKEPVVYTHANPRALCDSVRNKTDEAIKALAEKGGVIGISSYTPFAYLKLGVRPTVDEYIAFVDYVVKLVGVDYVGIGTDMADGFVGIAEAFERQKKKYPNIWGPWTVDQERMEGLEHVYHYPNITKGLVAHGYTNQEVEKILGRNFLRVFKRVFGK